MYKKYQTNIQAWEEVMTASRKSDRLTEITLQLYNQKNFIGLSKDQVDKVYEVYTVLKDIVICKDQVICK